MDYRQMREMEKTHCCAQCRGALVTIWDAQESRYRLVCGINRSHEGYQSILSPPQQARRGEIDESFAGVTPAKVEPGALTGEQLVSRILDRDLGSGEAIPRDKVLALVNWAAELGLKAYLGHVCLYYGRPYITIDGYYYLNQKRKNPYTIGVRPASDEERKAHHLAEGDYCYIAEAWAEGQKLPTTGLGIVTSDETTAKAKDKPDQYRAPVVHQHPQRMAEKRAEWQLLRKLIPLDTKEAPVELR